MIHAEISLVEGNPERALKYLGELDNYMVGHGGWDNIEKRLLIARAHLMADRKETAAEVLEELMRIHGGYAPGYFELGKVYEAMGRPDEARREYGKFLEAWREADEGQPSVIACRKLFDGM